MEELAWTITSLVSVMSKPAKFDAFARVFKIAFLSIDYVITTPSMWTLPLLVAITYWSLGLRSGVLVCV